MREMYAPSLPVDVEYHLKEGDAAGEILRMAGQLRPDLIVVGYARADGAELAPGGERRHVRRAARGCPVLALHRPEGPRKVEDIRVILHPTDFSTGCERSLRVARSLARDLGARLVLFHVVPFGFYANEMTVPIDPAPTGRRWRRSVSSSTGRT